MVLAATMIVALVARWWLVAGSSGGWGGDLRLYEKALLSGGVSRVSDTALAYLVWTGMIEVRESTQRLVRIVGPGALPDLHPVEAAVLGAVDPVGVRPDLAMATGREAGRSHVHLPPDHLVPDRARTIVDAVVLAGAFGVVAGAVWWLVAGESSGTGFVPLLALTALLVAVWWVVVGRPRLTAHGGEVLESLRRGYDDDLAVAAIGVTSLPMDRALTIIALYGRDALTGGLSGLRTILTGSPGGVNVRSR